MTWADSYIRFCITITVGTVGLSWVLLHIFRLFRRP